MHMGRRHGNVSTTLKEVVWYEHLKHTHCHRCPESDDCDVEDFLSCAVPTYKNFRKCSCYLCINNKRLRKIIESWGYYKDRPKQPRKRHYQYPEDYHEDLFEETTL
ncbi:hypothetical protein FJZ53_07145 [Candidatus Woesearchaeota archaeon]|nr:hypothetical protein [Candidatus Woesearchaeota archaeon]